MKTVTLPRLRCYRCVYEWTPHHSPVTMCPRCKSRYFNVPKIRPVVLGTGLGIEDIITPHRKALLSIAKKYGATNLRIFGSVRRHEATPESDVDLVVEWKPTAPPMAWLSMPREMEKVIHRKVDLGEIDSFYWTVRPQVEAEAVPL